MSILSRRSGVHQISVYAGGMEVSDMQTQMDMGADGVMSDQRFEVEANFVIFQKEFHDLLETDRSRFAVYRGQQRIAIMDTFRDALILVAMTGGFPASVQEITDRVECVYAN